MERGPADWLMLNLGLVVLYASWCPDPTPHPHGGINAYPSARLPGCLNDAYARTMIALADAGYKAAAACELPLCSSRPTTFASAADRLLPRELIT